MTQHLKGFTVSFWLTYTTLTRTIQRNCSLKVNMTFRKTYTNIKDTEDTFITQLCEYIELLVNFQPVDNEGFNFD